MPETRTRKFAGRPMTRVTIEQAQANLPKLIQQLQPGEEILITENGRPLAQMTKAKQSEGRRQAGAYQKQEFWMAPDFEAPIDDFKEYMK